MTQSVIQTMGHALKYLEPEMITQNRPKWDGYK